MPALRALISATAYPATLLLAGLAIVWLLDAGVDAGLASLTVSAGSVVIALALDRWLPREPAWSRSHGDVGTDLAHAFISGGLVEASRLGLFAAMAVAASWLTERLGFGLWPNDWPLLAQLALALVGMELFGYSFHRACHELEVFWRLHAVHHSAPRLYVLNTFRLHPLDSVLSIALQLGPLVLLGANGRVMAMFLAVIFAHAMLQHSNADLRLGPLNWFFAGPELHRWHHAPTLAEQKTNYGTVLILWDVVFGTRHLPERRPPVDVGLGTMADYPSNYLGQLASPFLAKLWRRTPTMPHATNAPSKE